MKPLHTLGRTLAGSLALTAALGVGALAAAPAHATVSDVDAGGAITRSMIVERAYSWATEKVPYSQSAYYPSSAPRTGTGHGYRQDCSGFVSMAWDLPTSAVTGDFVSASSAYDTKLSSWSQLQPGDLLGVSGHVILFLGWSADDAGRLRYFDMASESTTGHPAAVALDQDAQGYWKSYVPYRYKHVVTDAPAATSWGPGRADQVTLAANGHVIHRSQASTGASWVTQDLTQLHGFPIMRTPPAITSRGANQLDVIGTGTNGALIDYVWANGWTVRTLATSGTVYGISASGVAGRVDVFGRQPGNDGAGALVHGTVTGTSSAWSGWSGVGGSVPAIADDPATTRAPGSTIDIVVESADGRPTVGTWSPAGWTWAYDLGSTKLATRPTVTGLADGTTVVTATVGTALQQTTRAPKATAWSAWSAVAGVPALAGTPGWSSASAPPTSSSAAPLDVYALTSSGTVAHARRSSTGAWSYVGTD